MSFRGLPPPLQRVIQDRRLFHYTRPLMYWGSLPRFQAALALRPGERLLDVGCGTGICAGFARGPYLGIDTSLDSLLFARAHAGGGEHEFVAMRADALGLRPRSFDKALIVNVAHHLDDAEVDGLLCAVREVVSGTVVLVDLAPDVANAAEHLLIRYDHGEYMRPRAALRPLVARRYAVEHEETFHNTLRIVPQVLFRLVPGGDG